MPSRDNIIRNLAQDFRDENGTHLDLADFATFLLEKKVRPPRPPTEHELMMKAARRALKHEIRKDEVTGRPYHGWQAVPQRDAATGQLSFTYIDTDNAPREPMQKALIIRVSGMIDDGVQVTYDAEHWNRINPTEPPIEVDEMLDLRDQVEWRIAARAGESADGDDGEGGDGGNDGGGGDPDAPLPF